MKYRKTGGILTRKERKALIKSSNRIKEERKQFFMVLVTTGSASMIQGKLGFRKNQKDADFGVNAQAIFDALTLNVSSLFAPPFTDMAALEGFIKAFNEAVKNSKMKLLDAAAQKKTAKSNLYGCLKEALAYINNLAWNSQTNAEAMITGAKMVVKGAKSTQKQDLAVVPGKSTCEALLQCIAVKIDAKYYKATYNWQSSIDGGITWVALDDSQEAKLLVIGLVLGTVMKFRKRSNSKKCGLTKWCKPIDYTVV